MPIYAGSFRNYKHYRTFWYITHLVLWGGGGGPGSQIFCPDCHPTKVCWRQCIFTNNVGAKVNLPTTLTQVQVLPTLPQQTVLNAIILSAVHM